MKRRPPGEGGHVANRPRKYLLALAAVAFLPWLPLVDARQQHQQPVKHRDQQLVPIFPNQNQHVRGNEKHLRRESPLEGDRGDFHNAATAVVRETAEAPHSYARRKNTRIPSNDRLPNLHRNPNTTPDDVSALATSAPDLSVRAPSLGLRPGSANGVGLASQQIARTLEKWEVEDFVLLATVDGLLYASDRQSGKERWRQTVEQPMVETIHHRADASVLDDDYMPMDHYLWAVEPHNDGAIYLWVPSPEFGLTPIRTSLSMKRLVEDLAPHVSEDPAVVYTGDKKTSVVTLDAATGTGLVYFGSTESRVNDAATCFSSNRLVDTDPEECRKIGTITLGRTEYTVGIQRKDGKQIATLKYWEWTPNTFDKDLSSQYTSTMDDRYITSRPDGQLFGYDHGIKETDRPAFIENYSAPVARVFDIARPVGIPPESNPDLIVLPQPAPPVENERERIARDSTVFLNQTTTGSWYVLSGQSYPLVGDAPVAQMSRPDSWARAHLERLSDAQLSKALIGQHPLPVDGAVQRLGKHYTEQLTLPSAPSVPEIGSREASSSSGNDSIGEYYDADQEMEKPTIAKSIAQGAVNSVVDFVSNPVLILVFAALLIYYQKDLRRWHKGKTKGLKGLDTVKALLGQNIEVNRTPSSDSEEDEEEAADDVAKPTVEEGPVPQEKAANVKAEAETEAFVKHDTTVPDAVLERDVSIPLTPGSAAPSEGGKSSSPELVDAPTEEKKKKKAHRGRRGGAAHRKKNKKREDLSQSREDDPDPVTVEEAVNKAKQLGERPRVGMEPDIETVPSDMQEISGSIIRMGSLEVDQDQQLGTGSNGTVVYAGKFDGRAVAVKRMLIQFYDIASQETRLLRESDDHPNVIRYYAQQQRDAFLYIALELCQASLADVIEKPHIFRDIASAGEKDLPGVLYQITNGLSYLHSLRIVHRDLKPHNILVNIKDGKVRLLVSDFGLCKKLEGGQSSFGATTAHAAGTSGWRAPELLVDDDPRSVTTTTESTHSGSGSVLVSSDVMPNRRATRSIDIFSLGLVFFYVLTKGSHPFDCGDRYMREVNIRKGNFNLEKLDVLGDYAFEAKNLIEMMLASDPKRRPSAREVMAHPFFWPAKKRLSFLCDVSDHFEKEPREPPSAALAYLERYGPSVCHGDFLRQLPREFVDSLGKQRKYTGTRMLDLLRALRNKRNHYEDMAEALKKQVGPLPEGYLGFWTRRFSNLLVVCWNVVYEVEWDQEDRFREYYEPAGL